jgi:hypothetical protein
MNSDITTILFWIALISAPAFFTYLAAHVRNAQLRDILNAAASRAGGIAYAFLQQQVVHGDRMPSVQQAVDLGVDHMRSGLPQTLQSLGVGGQTLENIVRGELGKLLATDPNAAAVPTPSKQ